MANRGERSSQGSDAALPIFLGCGALVVLMCGGGFAAYSLLRIPPAVTLPTSGPHVALPVVAPTSAPTLAAPVSPAPEAEPAAGLGHGGGGFYNPSAGTPDPSPEAVTIHEGAEVTGALDPAVIQRIVRRHLAEVRACYERALAADPGLTARTVAHFTIGPDGAVTTATVDGSSDATLTTCIASRVRAWMFPAPEGGGVVTVNYPFVLTAS